MKIFSYISLFFSFIIGLFYYKNNNLKKEVELEKEKNKINEENLEVLKDNTNEFLKVKDFEDTIENDNNKIDIKNEKEKQDDFNKLEKQTKTPEDSDKISEKISEKVLDKPLDKISDKQEWISIKI